MKNNNLMQKSYEQLFEKQKKVQKLLDEGRLLVLPSSNSEEEKALVAALQYIDIDYADVLLVFSTLCTRNELL